MLARTGIADAEFVAFFGGIAYFSDWRNEEPIAAINTVLRAVDAASGIVGSELDANRATGCPAAARRGVRSFEPADSRRCVVYFEALRFARNFQRLRGRIRSRIVRHDFQIISAIGKC